MPVMYQNKKTQWARFNVREMPYACCGIRAIQNVGANDPNCLDLLIKKILGKSDWKDPRNLYQGEPWPNLWMVTLVSKMYIEVFKKNNFKVIHEFYNHNSGHAVSILVCQNIS